MPLAFAAVTIPFMLRKGERHGQTLGKQLFRLRVVMRRPRRREPAPRDRARAAREGAVLDRLDLAAVPARHRQLRLVGLRSRAARDPGPGDRHARRARPPRPVSEPAAPALVADLHVHYPMHVLSGDRDVTLGRMVRVRGREGAGNKARGAILWVASRLLNYRSWDAGPRVTADFLAAGGVRVGLSVLYSPFDEMDLDEPYGALPEPGYFARLIEQLEQVEAEIGGHAGRDRRPRRGRARPRARRRGRRAGPLRRGRLPPRPHPGRRRRERDRARRPRRRLRDARAPVLAPRRRQRAGDPVPARPVYNTLFPQKSGVGLTELGEAAVRAMYREGMLIDVSPHARRRARGDVRAADRLDRESGAAPTEHPVIASHSGYRFGKQKYNLDDEAVRRVAARGGVIGLILAQHQLNDGVVKKTKTFEESFDVIARHADRLRESRARTSTRRSAPTSTASSSRPWAARALLGPRPPAGRAERPLRPRGRREDPLGQRPTGAAPALRSAYRAAARHGAGGRPRIHSAGTTTSTVAADRERRDADRRQRQPAEQREPGAGEPGQQVVEAEQLAALGRGRAVGELRRRRDEGEVPADARGRTGRSRSASPRRPTAG